MSTLPADLLAARDITPDEFQIEAFAVLDRGESVLVTAPTSSGKTLVAEYGIATALEQGQRAAYTAPTKALSNQKLRELSSWLGADRVGLLTGDNVVRPHADVVVMTTEVLRNMIYAASHHVAQFGLTVLDEIHYLQDPYRGAVWEEIIISAPAHMRLVCLSATVSNARELARWIDATAGACSVVVCSQRPVPLEDRFLLFDRHSRRLVDVPTLRDGGQSPEFERVAAQASVRADRRHRHRRTGMRPARPRRSEVVEHLTAAGRLPAIVFVFSRQGCDDAARSLVAGGVAFLDGPEQHRVRQIATAHTSHFEPRDLAALGYDDWLNQLTAGVAAHHAGLMPAFKEAIEECFAAGLLAVVFATETLAVGVNMPARSVVVEQLSGYRGEGFALLTPGEYTQLTGRAGRRGIDEAGYAYTLWQPHLDFAETARLVASNEFELESSFRPTYNMVANLMASRTRDEAVDLLAQSFSQWRADRRVGQWTERLDAERAELRTARARVRSMGGGRGRPRSQAAARGPSARSGRHRRGEPSSSQGQRHLIEAERHVEQVAARVSRLKERIKLAEGGLVRRLDAVSDVLNAFECADGWSLTPTGDCLRAVFHESDLLTVLCLRDGVFDHVEPAQLAGLVSLLTYAHRSSQPPPAPCYPDQDSRTRAAHVFELAAQIRRAEHQRAMATSRAPDASFFATVYAWADGTPYADLRLSDAGTDQMLPGGDFVRQMRQLIDLLDRIADVAQQQRTRRVAAEARQALDRGVVASVVHVGDDAAAIPAAGPVWAATHGGPDRFAPVPVVRRTRRLS
ncbi:DEAD/DEAH box helicase [Candidatus Poriferisodalis sp.]|uniref:DEAD/DEAH box helicase n=1 Tax=Candidatus Poriferisodalis sp. TaxID=3101277 RepID=UPI003B016CF7